MKTIGILIIAFFLSCNLAVAQDTLYVYKAGAVLYKQVVTNIDSVTFKPVTIDTVARSPVQQQILALIKSFGLASVSSSSEVDANSIIRKGDVVEFDYRDNYMNTDNKLKINEELSTKDKMVYDGTMQNTVSGQLHYIRNTITSSDGDAVVKKQMTSDDKPISSNSEFDDEGTFEYALTTGGVTENKVKSDGTKIYQAKYVPNSPTSVTRIAGLGTESDLTNITIVLK
jgi:hypothetical protein